jgi:hypothetical protein
LQKRGIKTDEQFASNPALSEKRKTSKILNKKKEKSRKNQIKCFPILRKKTQKVKGEKDDIFF